MRLIIFIFGIGTIFAFVANASEALIIKNLDMNKILYQKGDIEQKVAPCCSFNIALGLMGFDLGILQDQFNPKWSYNEEEYKTSNDLWKAIHFPQNWIDHSCVWFSKEIVKKLGLENFKKYLSLFQYGNQDISGDQGSTNGFLHCWLSSSLKISPREQINFLQKLLKHELPITFHAEEMTKKIFFIEEYNGYKFFGKTGTGFQENGFQMGWFIGWLTKAERTLIFVILIEDEKNEFFPAGRRAKEKIKQLLLKEGLLGEFLTGNANWICLKIT